MGPSFKIQKQAAFGITKHWPSATRGLSDSKNPSQMEHSNRAGMAALV
jgi:hypothetical protein